MQAHIKLGRLFGVEIGLHYSWFLIALLIMFSLGGHFSATHPEWGAGVSWTLAILTGLLFFVSIGNIKPLFTCPPVGASPHPARVPLRHRVPSPSRASGWPALDAAGRPQASTAPTGPGDGEAARLWRRRVERQGCPKGLVQTHDRFKG